MAGAYIDFKTFLIIKLENQHVVLYTVALGKGLEDKDMVSIVSRGAKVLRTAVKWKCDRLFNMMVAFPTRAF